MPIKYKDKLIHDASAAYVNFSRKRETMSQVYKYNKRITAEYRYFFENYIKVLEYLKDDFGIKKMPDGELIEDELFDVEKYFRQYTGKGFKGKYNAKYLYRYWRDITILGKHYPLILDKLADVAKSSSYKDIDIDKDKLRLTINKDLFDLFDDILVKEKDVENASRV